MLYLMDISPDSWGLRPLSKLTQDIDIEISKAQTTESGLKAMMFRMAE